MSLVRQAGSRGRLTFDGSLAPRRGIHAASPGISRRAAASFLTGRTSMARSTMEHAQPGARAIFKADHPREIDRHIAFFGGEDAATRDMCGEALLDALTGRSDDEETPS